MSQDYSAKDITVLTGLEPVRKRPHMYIGSTDSTGLHHLIWEILDNAIDEVMNGFASKVEVILDADHQGITIVDNGRGIPVDEHEEQGRSALELILTTLHAGGKFGQGNYQYSGGLHGVGASVVNALSEKLVAKVKREGQEHCQVFAQGIPEGPVECLGKARGSGTSIWFRPDAEIFAENTFEVQEILKVLEARCYLHGFPILFKDLKSGEEVNFDPEEGLKTFLLKRIEKEKRDPLYWSVFEMESDQEPKMQLTLGWVDESGEKCYSFVNGVHTPEGGTHEQGLRTAVVRALRNYIEVQIGSGSTRFSKMTADDFRDGLRAVLSVYVKDPQFKGQTKDRLNNPELVRQVASSLTSQLEQYFYQHSTTADALIENLLEKARARKAAQDAQVTIQRKSVTKRVHLPGKLADCSRQGSAFTELFIVEGDSAGGSAKQGRNREYQAILPLRGKVLNTEQASVKKISANREINDLVAALGCGLGKKFDLSRLRYDRIVILTDADSDGHHIAGLLLTFFFRHMPRLIESGCIYLGRPPLFRLRAGKEVYWAWSEEEREEITSELDARLKVEITRFKGLGEMTPKQLKETTLDPRTRTLSRVQIQDEERAHQAFKDCFGRDAAPRFRFVMEQAAFAESVDV